MSERRSRGRLVAVGSARSCAVTTTATALAQAWPPPGQVVLAETDQAGGTVAARHGLAASPGLATWAAAARRQDSAALLTEHCQQLPGGLRVLPAPASGEQTRAALTVLGGRLAGLAEAGSDVVADCGRLDAGSLSWPVVEAADLVLLVCRPDLPDLHALAGWLDTHAGRVQQLLVVLAGPGAYPRAEVAQALAVDVVDGLPRDSQGLRELAAGVARHRKAARVRAADALAAEVLSRLPAPAEPPPPATADSPVAAAARAPAPAGPEIPTGPAVTARRAGALAGQVEA